MKEVDPYDISGNNSKDKPESFFNEEINQKRVRKKDKTIPINDFSTEDRGLIGKHYPELLQHKPAN